MSPLVDEAPQSRTLVLGSTREILEADGGPLVKGEWVVGGRELGSS